MDVASSDHVVADIAAAIGEPARARMLYSLLDGHARTSTELAILAEVSPSTASVHLQRLTSRRLVAVRVQGRHRYYALEGPAVAAALEALNVIAGHTRHSFVPTTPVRLRVARTCYDHIAGTIGVALHDRFVALKWLARERDDDADYDVTSSGERGFGSLGVDIDAARALRRRFAFACVDWSERRPHLGGALAAAVLAVALKRKWLVQDLDSRALSLTKTGKRELQERVGLEN
jgi:DNA-binding transcriptional ArsR family regulator